MKQQMEYLRSRVSRNVNSLPKKREDEITSRVALKNPAHEQSLPVRSLLMS